MDNSKKILHIDSDLMSLISLFIRELPSNPPSHPSMLYNF